MSAPFPLVRSMSRITWEHRRRSLKAPRKPIPGASLSNHPLLSPTDGPRNYCSPRSLEGPVIPLYPRAGHQTAVPNRFLSEVDA